MVLINKLPCDRFCWGVETFGGGVVIEAYEALESIRWVGTECSNLLLYKLEPLLFVLFVFCVPDGFKLKRLVNIK